MCIISFFFYFTADSSVDLSADSFVDLSNPEIDDINIPETQEEQVPTTTSFPSPDDSLVLEVTAEDPCDTSISQMQDAASELPLSASVIEDEKSEPENEDDASAVDLLTSR